jgi:chorismate mutase
VEACLQAGVDAVWIGARTTVNPFQVQELADALGDTDIPVLLKNPINPDANLWIGALERLYNAGVRKLALVHRGFSLYGQSRYRNEPLWRIPIELKRRFPGLPMICDPSHICGNTELIPSVAQFALDLLFDGLMIESHINPTEALSDCKQQLTPVQLADLLQSLRFSSPSPAHQADREELERLFGQVQNTDKLLIDLLAQRTSLVKQVGRYKKERGIALLQLKDLDRVLESCLEYGAENGLAPEFLTAIWQIIHENSIENQALAGEAHE